jgi:hypothetical protein
MIDTSQLTEEQLELVGKYKALYDRVGSLKLRMEILKQELTDSIEEIHLMDCNIAEQGVLYAKKS